MAPRSFLQQSVLYSALPFSSRTVLRRWVAFLLPYGSAKINRACCMAHRFLVTPSSFVGLNLNILRAGKRAAAIPSFFFFFFRYFFLFVLFFIFMMTTCVPEGSRRKGKKKNSSQKRQIFEILQTPLPLKGKRDSERPKCAECSHMQFVVAHG